MNSQLYGNTTVRFISENFTLRAHWHSKNRNFLAPSRADTWHRKGFATAMFTTTSTQGKETSATSISDREQLLMLLICKMDSVYS